MRPYFLLLGLSSYVMALDNLNVLADNLPDKQLHNDTRIHSSDSCPPGWYTFGDSCLIWVGTFFNWEGARLNCIDMGGDLVSVHSREELENVFTATGGRTAGPNYNYVWTGGNNFEVDGGGLGDWEWSDGTDFDWYNWAPGQPD